MKNKFTTLIILTVSTIALFSFSRKAYLDKHLEFTNGTDYWVDEMWITPHDSKTWEYKVELDHALAPHEHEAVDLTEIKGAFDVFIRDNHAHKDHEYDNFKLSDLGTKWELLGDEVEIHHEKPKN
jgi:hypothetical protein